MITSAKYQPGDLVSMITDMALGPCMVVGVTEWLGGSVSYTVAKGVERMELYGEELTAALMDGKPLHADDFGPGEGVRARVADEGEDGGE